MPFAFLARAQRRWREYCDRAGGRTGAWMHRTGAWVQSRNGVWVHRDGRVVMAVEEEDGRAVMALGMGPATGVHGTGRAGVHGTGLHRTDAWVHGTGADDIREINEEVLVAAAFPCCALRLVFRLVSKPAFRHRQRTSDFLKHRRRTHKHNREKKHLTVRAVRAVAETREV